MSKIDLKNYRDESRGTVPLKSYGGRVKPLILIAETVSQAGGKHQEMYNMLIDTNCWWLLKYNILPPPNQKPSPNIQNNDVPLFTAYVKNYVLWLKHMRVKKMCSAFFT